MADGVTYTIHGIKLVFPCKAYPTQLSMMDKIMKGLDKGKHCLLESPTGSGKSLALLCSCLAWQTAEYEKAVKAAKELEKEKEIKKENEKEMKKENENTDDCCGAACKRLLPQEMTPDRPQVIDLTTIKTPTKQLFLSPNEDNVGKVVKQKLDQSEDVEEEDFKSDNKRFRTPGPSRSFKPETNVSRGEDEDSNENTEKSPPEWDMELLNKESPSADKLSKSPEDSDSKSNKKLAQTIKVPKIYFGTRTHKQISQIARELGKTVYRFSRMCILSSREQSCIHPRVSQGRNKNEECKKLRDNTVKGERGRGDTCPYYQKGSALSSQRGIKSHGLSSAWDIEDLTRVGKKLRACPYYSAKELMKEADIVFCPYNYLIDPKIRVQMEIDLTDQIVILDEAHNVEDSARESASFTINQVELQETLDDMDKLISWKVMPDHYKSLHGMCAGLMRWMTQNSEHRMKERGFEQAVSVLSGMDIIDGLKEAGITPGTYELYKNRFSEIMAADKDPANNYEKTSPPSHSVAILEGLLLVFQYLFAYDGKFVPDYRVTTMKTAVVVRKEQQGGWKRAGFGSRKEWVYSLNFWCFNPAVVFSQIGAQARSIILTSGTLSPMSSFASELGVEFSIKLEANHVIANSQVWVGTLSVGPSNSPINATYRFAETFSFQDDIGRLALEVCEKVPHGVLCFFPSYNMLEKISKRWQTTGMWSKLLQKKVVLSEPRSGGKSDFDDIMHEFYQAIRRSEGEEEECIDSDEEDGYGSAKGALFLAVCRGKVSEGLDFADNNARAVITIGIPFPNTKDLKVDLKRKYNDEYAAKRGLLSGSEWYEIQAFRALNQALGRCIRHKQDWGAILLVDERFSKTPRYSNSISKWLRQRIQHYRNFHQAIGSLKDFADARQLVPCPGTQTPKPTPNKTPLSTDGSFILDTSPLREDNGLSGPSDSHKDSASCTVLDAGQHTSGDQIKQEWTSTPNNHLRFVDRDTPGVIGQPSVSVQTINSRGPNTDGDSLFVNAQLKNQAVPMAISMNSQSLVNAGIPVRSSSPALAPNMITPQQLLYLTPVQAKNQSVRGQTPGSSLAHTAPAKMIVFTAPASGHSRGNSTMNHVVAEKRDVPERVDIATGPSSDFTYPRGQDGLTKKTKSTWLKTCTRSTIKDQSGVEKPNVNVKDDVLVDRNRSTQECADDSAQDISPNQPDNIPNHKRPSFKTGNSHEAIGARQDDGEVNMPEFEYPESPDMFSTPFLGDETPVQTRVNCDAKKNTGEKSDEFTNGKACDKMLACTAVPRTADRGVIMRQLPVKSPLCRYDIPSDKNGRVSQLKTAEANGVEHGEESSMQSKKQRVDEQPTCAPLQTSRRSDGPCQGHQTNPTNAVSENEQPDESKTPLRRNLRRTAQRRTTRPKKGNSLEDETSVASDDSCILCCKRCDAKVFEGIAIQQTVHSQPLTMLYDQASATNHKARANKKRKRGSKASIDRVVWAVDKNNVDENLQTLVEATNTLQQDSVLNALYAASENNVYVPITCVTCHARHTDRPVIGVQVFPLSLPDPLHSSNTGYPKTLNQVWFFTEAVHN